MVQNGDESHPTQGHNQICRERIEAKMREDPVLKGRVQAADQRRDEYLAKRVKKEDDKKKRKAEEQPEKKEEPAQAPDVGEHDGEPRCYS